MSALFGKTKRELVLGLVSRLCGRPVTQAMNLRNDLGLSPSQVSLLLFRLEHDFGISFPDTLIADTQLTLRKIIDFLEYE